MFCLFPIRPTAKHTVGVGTLHVQTFILTTERLLPLRQPGLMFNLWNSEHTFVYICFASVHEQIVGNATRLFPAVLSQWLTLILLCRSSVCACVHIVCAPVLVSELVLGITKFASLGIRIGIGKEKMVLKQLYLQPSGNIWWHKTKQPPGFGAQVVQLHFLYLFNSLTVSKRI